MINKISHILLTCIGGKQINVIGALWMIATKHTSGKEKYRSSSSLWIHAIHSCSFTIQELVMRQEAKPHPKCFLAFWTFQIFELSCRCSLQFSQGSDGISNSGGAIYVAYLARNGPLKRPKYIHKDRRSAVFSGVYVCYYQLSKTRASILPIQPRSSHNVDITRDKLIHRRSQT